MSKKMIATVKGRTYELRFPFDWDTVAKVKRIPGRKFYSQEDDKFWTVPRSHENEELLLSWGFTVKHSKASKRRKVPRALFKKPLYPFQRIGVQFIEDRYGRALIGDEMGLGKTVQALGYLQLHPELRPVIVVCPASLKLNWEQEIITWMGEDNNQIQLLYGRKASEIYGDIIIVNYDILDAWKDVLIKTDAKVLITDECHYYKNNRARRTKAIKKIAKAVPSVIALSGTPIVNRPIEIFNALKIVGGETVPDFWSFVHRYCGAKKTRFGWDFSRATNTEELHTIIKDVMLRRRKEDVLPDLPEKRRAYVPIKLNNERQYRKAEDDFITFLKETKGVASARKALNAKALAELEGLKQLAAKGKMKMAIDWIRNAIDSDGKLIVFASHKSIISQLMETFGDIAVKIDGSIPSKQRQAIVEKFQTDETVRLFVGNIQAAGVGITLTAASNVAFLELPWTPAELIQAEDRAHRIGQRNSVTCYYLLAKKTIEDRLIALIDKKRKILDSVLDGQETEAESLLNEVINSYKE